MIFTLVLLGLALRGMCPGRMAVEHFDEGVYASNLWFDADERFRYPARHLYAPPLLPWLLEWSQIVFGPTHLGTLLVGIVSGSLTIGLIWWVVRRWFGASAGMAAAALAAFSDYHGLFSRTALTEPVLCLLLLLSVYYLWVSLVTLELRPTLFAGICAGLAWCTKYNGWLPLAIGGAGLSAWAIRPYDNSSQRGRRFLLLGLIAAMALLIFSPVLRGLREDGGYRAVQENHARYLVGFSGWLDSFGRQLASHRYIDGPISWIGLMLAVLCAVAMDQERQTTRSNKTRAWFWAILWSALFAVLAIGLGTSVVLGLAGLIWLLTHCPWWRGQESEHRTGFGLAYWLIAAWFVGLFLSTPLYTPYPRLSLPWLLAAWITSAAMLGSPVVQRLAFGQRPWQSSRKGTACLCLMALVSVSAFLGKMMAAPPSPPAMWEDRPGLESIAHAIHQEVITRYGGEALIYVYAEPALFFHLKAGQLDLVAPVADLGFAGQPAPVPVLLAVGPHAERSEDFQSEFQQTTDRWELLDEFPYRPSPLVLLDQLAPEEINAPNSPREQTVRLYRLKSP